MPHFCAAYGCSNERSFKTRAHGITFHSFPQNAEKRRQWELALRRDGFVASKNCKLCSEHFRSEDFDRTGQTVRLKAGVVPTIFNFPAHLQRPVATRSTAASRRAEENLPMDLHQDEPPPAPQAATGERRKSLKRKAPDHLYALPSCPKAIKAKLNAALATVRKLQREKSNSLARERRAKKNMHALLEELKEKNLINEELKEKLECYSDLPVHLLSRQGVEYTKAQREFALTLHLHGPKAYHYLRDTLKIHLPHPSSLQRWLSTVKVVRAAEWVVRQAAADSKRSQPIKVLEVLYMVRKRIGSEDVFLLGEHINDTRYGIDSHHNTLLTLVVSLFFKLRLHHIAKMSTLSQHQVNVRQKLTKTVLFKGQ